MTTSRQRFLDTLDFKPVDKPWIRWGSFIWPETIEIWETQGYKGYDLDEYFGLDRLLRVDPWYGPVPPFEYTIIDEDEQTRTYINHEGILMREFKEHQYSSMPQFIKFPVENQAEFDEFAAQRLRLNVAERFDQQWHQEVKAGGRLQQDVGKGEHSKARQAQQQNVWPRLCWADRWGGFFGSLRNLMGVENACCAFYEQPKLVEKIMDERANSIIKITEEVLRHTQFETFWFWEDMAYNNGPLVGPELFEKFAGKYYKRVCDWLRSKGIKHIGLDSDGDIWKLIPVWLDNGINILWPFEVQSNMDVNKVRQKYPDLVIMGGINKKEIAKGGDAMRSEVDRIIPLVEKGGYIPELDHSIPPDISWPVFCDYIEYLKKRLNRD
jgi:hypothetical protein